VNGLAGNDTIVVQNLTVPLTVDGGDGIDTVVAAGGTGADTFTVTAAPDHIDVGRTSGTAYSVDVIGAEQIIVDVGADSAADSVIVTGGAANENLVIGAAGPGAVSTGLASQMNVI